MHVFKQAYVAIGHDTDVAEGVSKASGKVFGRGLNTMVLFSGALDSLEPFAEYGLPTDGSVDTAELLLDLRHALAVQLSVGAQLVLQRGRPLFCQSGRAVGPALRYHRHRVPAADPQPAR